uniref:glycogenin glucosyltransferase n=1 Tax=Anopheles atroparvus TaxID=41427 RepID=A0AAG5DMS4_ANOAO
MSKYAWVTLATNDSYSLGALVVAHSLKRVHTVHQLAVLITPGVSEAMKTKLRNVFNVVEEVNLLDSKDEANLALLKRPELGITFTKLHCWRLTQFEKCVFLDADTLVLRNSDELFEREELSAAPDIGWPDCFNSGVYVYRPNLDTFASLLKYAVTNGSFDGGDQGLLNAYFSDWAHTDIQKHLPFIYNTSSVATYSYLPAFKHFGQNTKILHFIGVAKPWLQNFNSETRKVYVPSECQHLANFLQYWWDIFADDVHSRLSPDMSGLAGALAQLHMGEAKTQEQEAYEEHMRRQCWETGNIDYMGRDSFDNIWKRIQQTLGGGGTAEAAPTAAAAKAADRTPPATPRASRSRSSRSRSTTPKRDGRDRSPTPQPEDKVPLEKKEGYQQFITTKSPEGKTRSHTKLVYDPSVDVEEEDEPEPEPEPVQVGVVAPPARTRKTEDVVDSVPVRVARKATAVAFPNPKPAPTATPPQSQTTSTLPTNEPPRSPIVPKKASPPAVTPPVQQQQVAQETLAGKPSASIEPTQPVKTVRKKRHISSLPLRPSSTATPAPTSTISADGAQSSSPSASASSRTPPPASLRKPRQPAKARVVSSSGSPDLTATPSTTKAELPLHSSSPAAYTRTTSGGKQETMTPTRTTNATQPPSSSPSSILTLRNPSSSSLSRGVGLKQHDEANSVVSAAAVDDAKMTPAVPSSPPVPPRRKRESKMARLGKKKPKLYQLLLSCFSCTRKKQR